MELDNKDFFFEATLRICSSLEIEKALWSCFMYIRDVMPVNVLVLTILNLDEGIFTTIATATEDGGKLLDLQIPVPHQIFKRSHERKSHKVMIANNPERHPFLKYVVPYYGKDSSMMNIRLIIENQFIGGLFVATKGMNRYTNDHAELLATLSKPLGIALANSLKHREVISLKEKLEDHNKYLRNELKQIAGEEIIGQNTGLRQVMESVQHVAHLTTPVLLIGETGTGKEIIANAIHNLSPRKDNPFIKVNCGAIPETLVDSELFGHEKGAFTGAITQKKGYFERANGGTIFLDEVGELPLNSQVRLLRVLQDKQIDRVGGSKPIKLDIRIVAATNRNLESLVHEKKFRDDLYFRLRVFPILIPPLKNRKQDILPLTNYFIGKKSKEMGIVKPPTLAPGSMDRLLSYHWPGNVRELENAVERTLILQTGGLVDFSNIIFPSLQKTEEEVFKTSEPKTMNDILIKEISNVLKLTNGKIEGKSGAAQMLRMKPNTLRYRMKKLGIPFGRSAQ